MTKLQKQLSRKVGDKEYAKYVAVIPPNVIEDAGFREGEELDIKSERGKIVIAKKKK